MRDRMHPEDFPLYARPAAHAFAASYRGADYAFPKIDMHARACRLRSDAGDAPWRGLASFAALGTRGGLPNVDYERPALGPHTLALECAYPGARAALCDLLHVLITEGE